ncbi:unnamed protein product, partial [marine sediment metagenome]
VEFVEQVKEPLHVTESKEEQNSVKFDSYEEEKPYSKSTDKDYSEDFNL